MPARNTIRRVEIKFAPFNEKGKVSVLSASGKEISFKKIVGMRLLTLRVGIKRKEKEVQIYLEVSK